MIFFSDLAAVALAVFGPPNPLGSYWRALSVVRDAWLEAGGCAACGGLGMVEGRICSQLYDETAAGAPITIEQAAELIVRESAFPVLEFFVLEELLRQSPQVDHQMVQRINARRPLFPPGHGPLDPFLLLGDITRKQAARTRPPRRMHPFSSSEIVPPGEVRTLAITPLRMFRPMKLFHSISEDLAAKIIVEDLGINGRTQFHPPIPHSLSEFNTNSIGEQQRWDVCMADGSIEFVVRNTNDVPVTVTMTAFGYLAVNDEGISTQLRGHVVE